MRPHAIGRQGRVILILALTAFLFGMAACSPHNLRRGGGFNGGDRGKIVATAERYLGVPYRFGGESPDGFDCSGLVMYVYGKHGMLLPRTADDQYAEGSRVAFAALQPGDLVFFHTAGGRRISHVGIYAGGGRFIHAPRSGKDVSYARLDNSYWKKHYAGGVTYFRRKSQGTVRHAARDG